MPAGKDWAEGGVVVHGILLPLTNPLLEMKLFKQKTVFFLVVFSEL